MSFIHENPKRQYWCCDPSLEQPWKSSSNKELQCMFSLENMISIFPGLFYNCPYLCIIIVFVHATIRSWDCWEMNVHVYSWQLELNITKQKVWQKITDTWELIRQYQDTKNHSSVHFETEIIKTNVIIMYNQDSEDKNINTKKSFSKDKFSQLSMYLPTIQLLVYCV